VEIETDKQKKINKFTNQSPGSKFVGAFKAQDVTQQNNSYK